MKNVCDCILKMSNVTISFLLKLLNNFIVVDLCTVRTIVAQKSTLKNRNRANVRPCELRCLTSLLAFLKFGAIVLYLRSTQEVLNMVLFLKLTRKCIDVGAQKLPQY